MNETPLLTMQNISKRFPGVNALKNVSLEIARGEVLRSEELIPAS